MTQKIIEHPLRKIVFEYDDAIPETEYEKQLLQAYITLHNSSEALIKQSAKLYYEFKVSEDTLDGAEKDFELIAEVISYEHTRLPDLMMDIRNVFKVHDIKLQLTEFFSNIATHHDNWIKPMQAEQQKLDKEYEAFEETEESFYKEFEEYDKNFSNILYREYDKYSLDLVSYDQDIDNLRALFSKLSNHRKEMDAIALRYKNIMDKMEATYKQWDEIKSWLE